MRLETIRGLGPCGELTKHRGKVKWADRLGLSPWGSITEEVMRPSLCGENAKGLRGLPSAEVLLFHQKT